MNDSSHPHPAGAGPTPYSRRSDGRAVLRSSVREFLASEFMHHLGVPTSRALSLSATAKPVVIRDQFYDGNAQKEPGAIVLRMAPTWVRFGTFEILASRREDSTMASLADHIIANHMPHLARGGYAAFLAEVMSDGSELTQPTGQSAPQRSDQFLPLARVPPPRS